MGKGARDSAVEEHCATLFDELVLLLEESEQGLSALKKQDHEDYRRSIFANVEPCLSEAIDKLGELVDVVDQFQSRSLQSRWQTKLRPVAQQVGELTAECEKQSAALGQPQASESDPPTESDSDAMRDSSADMMDEDSSDAVLTENDDNYDSDDVDTPTDEGDSEDPTSEDLSSSQDQTSSDDIDEELTLEEIYGELTSALGVVQGDITLAMENDDVDVEELVENAAAEFAEADRFREALKMRLEGCSARDRRAWKERCQEVDDRCDRIRRDLGRIAEVLDANSSMSQGDESQSETSSDAELESKNGSFMRSIGSREAQVVDMNYSEDYDASEYSASSSATERTSTTPSSSQDLPIASPVAIEDTNSEDIRFEERLEKFAHVVHSLRRKVEALGSTSNHRKRSELCERLRGDLVDAQKVETQLIEKIKVMPKSARGAYAPSLRETKDNLQAAVQLFDRTVEASAAFEESAERSISSVGSGATRDDLEARNALAEDLYEAIDFAIAGLNNDVQMTDQLSAEESLTGMAVILEARADIVKDLYSQFRAVHGKLPSSQQSKWNDRSRTLQSQVKKGLQDHKDLVGAPKDQDEVECLDHDLGFLIRSLRRGQTAILRMHESAHREKESELHSEKIHLTRSLYNKFKDEVRALSSAEEKKDWLPRAKNHQAGLKDVLSGVATITEGVVEPDSAGEEPPRNELMTPRSKSGNLITPRRREPVEPIVERVKTRIMSSNDTGAADSHSGQQSPDQASNDMELEDEEFDDGAEEEAPSSRQSRSMSGSTVPDDAEKPRCFCLPFCRK